MNNVVHVLCYNQLLNDFIANIVSTKMLAIECMKRTIWCWHNKIHFMEINCNFMINDWPTT